MILVFDLDDTLYDETSFVVRGFHAVAGFLEKTHSIPVRESVLFMEDRLRQDGRGAIFDDLLNRYDLYSRQNVMKCISVYRYHRPDIRLYSEADLCLERFKEYPLYIVTDGNKIVQKNKLIALNLYERVRFCFLTHRYGIKHAKPSPYCFFAICRRERVKPSDVLYVGDNPQKDFVGIKPEGFRTVRVLKGQHKNVMKPDAYEAEYRLESLEGLTTSFIRMVFGPGEKKKY